MYTVTNYKTKKALKEAVMNGVPVSIFQPEGIFTFKETQGGPFAIEGPHFPESHRWYAQVWLKEGKVVKVT